jgi:Rps23 Pro-64 3,4-dihydroxylase Tpa1-like proline 4-hydroxylase
MAFGANSDINLLTVRRAPINDLVLGDVLDRSEFSITSDVMIFPAFVKKDVCDKIVEFANARTEWQKAATYADHVIGKENSARQAQALTVADFPQFDAAVYNIFNAALTEYRKEYVGVEVSEDDPYQLLRYTKGGHYKPHLDRGSGNNRVVSGLIYLNDDYVGGALYFPRQEFTVQPQRGMVVMFPSFHTHLHASLDIESGTKYALVTWFK